MAVVLGTWKTNLKIKTISRTQTDPQNRTVETPRDFPEQERKCFKSLLPLPGQQDPSSSLPPSPTTIFTFPSCKQSMFGFTPPHEHFLYLLENTELGEGKCWSNPFLLYKPGQHTATKAACSMEQPSLCFRIENEQISCNFCSTCPRGG